MLSTNNTLANIKSKIDELVKDGMMVYNLYFEEQILYRIGFYKTDIYTYYFDTKLHEKKIYFNDSFNIMDIYSLYQFDHELRSLIINLCTCVEMKFKVFISNCIYDISSGKEYLDISNFKNEKHYKDLIYHVNRKRISEDISSHINDNTKYTCNTKLHIYLICELLTFGEISKMYGNLQNGLKKKIIMDNYNNRDVTKSWLYVDGWLKSICDMRNICAHNGKLFDWKNTFKNEISLPRINKYKEYKNQRGSLFSILLVTKLLFEDKYFIESDNTWNLFIDNLDNCINKYTFSCKDFNPLDYMGFPSDWIVRLS
ncbi:Abi family protein [Romboutsia ilealis]|uniref:Abi family protein n=1 Tax=Romboutsia faecis TaxID=2764597 RepID=A0ABR7JPE1_9FIRM|nr:Abi family protein [Romboutsia faecis]MBC5996790.1 Abi family protein [Romboutsia faecis]MRN24754.1 Abi family protein [Romboutsia ilealis]